MKPTIAFSTRGLCLGLLFSLSSGLAMAEPELPLRLIAESRGLFFGAAIGRWEFLNDPIYMQAYEEEVGMMVPMGPLKWDMLRPSPTTWDFSTADAMRDEAVSHGRLLRGATLVWHNALPAWVANTINKDNAESYLVGHIQTVMGRYAGQMHHWDVVNEAIKLEDDLPGGVRNSPWYWWLGKEYVRIAFAAAAAADPQAKSLLVYNEFGLDMGDAKSDAKFAAVLALVDYIRSGPGCRLDAVGFQGHLEGDRTDFDPLKLRARIRALAERGLKVIITELDVRDQYLPAAIPTRDAIVANVYSTYLNTVLAEPNVIGVVTFGISDKYTWLADFPRPDGLPVRPLPLGASMYEKKAYEAIAAALLAAPHR